MNPEQKGGEPVSLHPKHAKLSYLLILISSACGVSAFIYPNEKGMHPWETNLVKAYPACITAYFICWYKGHSLMFRSKRDFYITIIRNIIFMMYDLAAASVQFRLPLPILHSINNSSAIIIMLIQYLIEGKRLSKSQKQATAIALTGIVLIVNSRYIEHIIRPNYKFESEFANYASTEAISIAIWSLFLLAIVILTSTAIYMTSLVTMNAFQIIFHYQLIMILFNSLLYTTSHSNHDLATFLWAFPSSSLLFAVGQFAFIGSVQYSHNIGVTMLLSTFMTVVGYIWSVFRYHEQITITCVAGSMLIITSIYKLFMTP